MSDSQTTQTEVKTSPAKDLLKLPWRLDIRPGKKKFDEETGEPVELWIRNAEEAAVTLFIGKSEQPLAEAIIHRVNFYDELVTALNGAIVALRMGSHVDEKAAIEYGLEVLAKAKGGAE